MKHFLINRNSNDLLIFFAGWGCDEYEFEHLETKSDVLILYDYCDLKINFDFSKYNNFNLIAFSAGVFTASVVNFDFRINKKIALSGNPYLFDERSGLSKKIQDVLYNITVETADDFARNYLVMTDEEWEKFHHSKRTIESCREEFNALKEIYQNKKADIKDIYDFALIGDNDPIFNVSYQKDFFGNRLKIIENARHNLFFRFKNYEEIIDMF